MLAIPADRVEQHLAPVRAATELEQILPELHSISARLGRSPRLLFCSVGPCVWRQDERA